MYIFFLCVKFYICFVCERQKKKKMVCLGDGWSHLINRVQAGLGAVMAFIFSYICCGEVPVQIIHPEK